MPFDHTAAAAADLAPGPAPDAPIPDPPAPDAPALAAPALTAPVLAAPALAALALDRAEECLREAGEREQIYALACEEAAMAGVPPARRPPRARWDRAAWARYLAAADALDAEHGAPIRRLHAEAARLRRLADTLRRGGGGGPPGHRSAAP